MTLIKVVCGYFRAEFHPIATYMDVFTFIVLPEATRTNCIGWIEIFVLDPIWLSILQLCFMYPQKEAFTYVS